jgi:hypothetical protein
MLDYNGRVLEEMIWNWIVELVTHPEQVETMLRAQQAAAEEKNRPLKARIATIDSLIDEKNAERERLP